MFYCSSFFKRIISVVPCPMTAKFCIMVESMFNVIMLVPKFGGLPAKIFWGKKHANFGQILDPFPL